MGRRNCQMASKGKKGRGGKGKTLNLTEFLGPDGGSTYKAPGGAATVAVEIGSSWADQMERERPCTRGIDLLRRLYSLPPPPPHLARTSMMTRSHEDHLSLLTSPTCRTTWTRARCRRCSREPGSRSPKCG